MSTANLYYEDVNVGDAVRPLLTYVDQVMCVEWGYVSNNTDVGHWHIWSNRHKQSGNPKEPVTRRGQDPTLHGQFKAALLEKMLLDWAGPKAWVQMLDVQYRAWDYPFELKTLTGKVAGKREEAGAHLVDVELQMANEEGQPTTRGTATVALPTRL
jgi:hypothetical protein